MLITDDATGLPVADPEIPLIPREAVDGAADELASRVTSAVSQMILSASGWRAVFAADGSEESRSRDVAPELLIVSAVAADCYYSFLAERLSRTPRIAVAVDTRPTGPKIASAAIRALLKRGGAVDYLFVAASPEIMAYTATAGSLDGFFYVSASHNPIGHNGLKMGGADGGVLGGRAAAELIRAFRTRLQDPAAIRAAAQSLAVASDEAERKCLGRIHTVKSRALEAYSDFCHRVIRGPGPRADEAYDALRAAVASAKPGIVGDLNGSARAASIDRAFLSDTGCRVVLFNDRPGAIDHQIVPEGAGLAQCRSHLEELGRGDPSYVLGYVPDNDGDRGNLVVYDADARSARQLQAQEVFALSVVAELSWLVYTGALQYGRDGSPDRRVAVVVNGPTSLRIDRIAALFGAEVHRAEVGEANVVGRARELREEGVLVRILGEGSNGGNITHPSAVRDPLHTLHAVLKLVVTPRTGSGPSPASIWLGRAGHHSGDGPSGLNRILGSLPAFTTTSAYESEAKMQITSTSQAALKRELERMLPDAVAQIEARLAQELAIASYRIANYEGTQTRPGPGNRSGEEKGGLKIVFADRHDTERAFAWMRGSGTEPVFRVMADVEGDRPELHAKLLDWLRGLVAAASAAADAATVDR
jgi:phosphomannomutase